MRAALAAVMLAALATPVASQAPRWIIGGESDAATQLGQYVGVVATPKLIVVLERDAPFLKVFGHDGRLVQRLGRSGAGPGEFRGASGISYDAEGRRVLVVDQSNARVYAFAAGDTLSPPVASTLDQVGVRSVCVAGGRLYAVVRNAPKIVRELQLRAGRATVTGEPFGDPKTAHQHGDHPLVRTRASDGPALCRGDGRSLLIASRLLGEVHTFDLATRRQRTDPVPRFQGAGITVESDAMTIALPVGESQSLVGLVEWGKEVIVVAERMVREGNRQAEPSGYRLGTMGATPSALGPVHAWRPVALLATGALCARNDPAPTLGLFPGTTCP